MKAYENVDLEFKEIYVSDIKKEVIAFANTQGGILYVGVQKDGTVVGVENPDEVMLQISGSVKDSIKPDVMPFVQVQTIEKEGKPVVEVRVEVGAGRPYYLQEKGLKPSGVYVRRGSSSQPLSDEGIRAMIIENSGSSYETCRSMNQDLTFDVFMSEMKSRGLECGLSQMKTLHLLTEDNLYTNLAVLLSDQCEHSIKLAIHQGSEQAVFRDRKEFSGSILKQIHDVFEAIDLYNKTKATFEGLNRMDKRDYPVEAIRETLLNAVVHRDYAFSGSILIHLYDDRMEFVSLGGLVPGLSMEAIYMGVSQPRNIHLASIFYRMKLIESYGTGISKIRELYRYEVRAPKFESATGVFHVTLPNCNEFASAVREDVTYHIDNPSRYIEMSHPTGKGYLKRVVVYNRQVASQQHKEKILAYAQTVPFFKRKDIEQLLGLKTTSVFHLLKELCEEGKIRTVGSGKNSAYELMR